MSFKINDDNYILKYIKYKQKFLNLKHSLHTGGGSYKKVNTYQDLQNFNCNEGICKFKNNKISKIKYKDYVVSVSNNRVHLWAKNAKYSEFGLEKFDINFGYLIEMKNIINHLIKLNPNKKFTMLVLGFGLGAAPLHFSTYNNIIKIDTIDLDYDLFRLYKTTTDINNINVSEKINYIYGDGIEYLKECKNNGIKYDFILDDIFDSSHKVDYDFSLAYDCLENDGMFFMNVHYKPKEYVKLLKKDNYKVVNFINHDEFLIYAHK